MEWKEIDTMLGIWGMCGRMEREKKRESKRYRRKGSKKKRKIFLGGSVEEELDRRKENNRWNRDIKLKQEEGGV